MKKTLLCMLLLWVLLPEIASAQDVALGERLPKVKIATWLDDRIPEERELTYLEFFSANNPQCRMSLLQLQDLSRKFANRLSIVIVTKDPEEKVRTMLLPYLSDNIGVVMDRDHKIYTSFDVKYVPFGVLHDSKRRAVWMGNTLKLTEEIIDKK